MNVGREDAVFRRLLNDVTAESCAMGNISSLAALLDNVGGHGKHKTPKQGTHNPIPHNTRYRWRHIDTIPNNKIGRQHRDLVFLPGSLLPRLLPNHPDIGRLVGKASVGLCRRLQRVIRDYELQPLHRFQSSFEGLPGFHEMAKGFIVVGLDGQRGIVGRRIKERRLGKIEQD